MHITNYFSKFKDSLKKAISSKPITYEKAYDPIDKKQMGTKVAPKTKLSSTPSNGKGVGY